ncbi:papilin-like isoform X3 [Dermacentor silvarum]|uniref:papilin-like isoform X3 n=1 Tax=Dermacentor silvarum TaxID=543639 RepID=UPI00189ACA34|nr:papilin-like isoform X3 [Dermacentor silvarum]
MRILLFTFLTCYIGKAASSNRRCLSMPTDDEECDSNTNKWYYNKVEGNCENFMYGDCPVQGNIFDTKDECTNTCKNAGEGQHKKKPGSGYGKGSKGRPTPSRPSGSSEKNAGGGTRRPGRKGSEEDETGPSRGPGKGHGGNRWPPRPSIPQKPKPHKPHRPVYQNPFGGTKHRPRPPHQRPGKGSCGARPKRGDCDDNRGKWFNNGPFMTCSRVRKGNCPTVGSFFESCEDCMRKCRPNKIHTCQFMT